MFRFTVSTVLGVGPMSEPLGLVWNVNGGLSRNLVLQAFATLLRMCSAHARFGSEPANCISVALCSLDFVPHSVALRDPWFLRPKILDSISFSPPCCCVVLCDWGTLNVKFHENRERKSNGDFHPLFFAQLMTLLLFF